MVSSQFVILALTIIRIAPAENLGALHSIKCNEQSCPEGLAKIVVTENSSQWKCTGFLISDNVLMTNRHCLPDGIISKVTTECKKSIQIFFAEMGSFPAEKVGCKKVRSFSGSPNALNVATLDYAFLELDRSVSRKALTVSHEGVFAGEKLTFWRVDGLVESAIRKDQCETIYQSLLFPFTNSSDAPVSTFDHCLAEHGNSGSPLMNSKGEVVAILEGMNNEKNINFFEKKFGAKNLKNVMKGSNFSCINRPHQIRSLPLKCLETRAEKDFLTEGNEILKKRASSVLNKSIQEFNGLRLADKVLYDPEYTPTALRSNRLLVGTAPDCIFSKEDLRKNLKTLKETPDQKYSLALGFENTQICKVNFAFSPEMEVTSVRRSECRKANATILLTLPEKDGADVPFYFAVQDADENLLASVEETLSSCKLTK